MKLAVLCAVVAALAAAQDTAQVTGAIEGVVVNKVTGAGIGDAIVRFLGYSPIQAVGTIAPASGSTNAVTRNVDRYETHTDETGAFRITGVKPGDYSASVEKSGYFPVDTEFVLFSGERPKHHVVAGGDPLRVRLELNPPAVIRGRVIGADGNPARAEVDLGRGRTASTDAEGSFAFDNLEPGPYTLLAHPKAIEPVSKPEGSRTEVVPTYYPSAVDPTQAESIVVRAGAELSGYEIRLQSVPVYRVRGVVLNPDGKPATKAVVELQARGTGGDPDRFFLIPGGARQSFSIQTSRIELLESEEPVVTGTDGAFEFPSVPSGDWTVRAEGDPVWDPVRNTDVSSVGSAAFSLGHGDPDDLKIQLATPFHLFGIAVLSDGSPPANGLLLSVRLYSETGRAGSGGITEPGGVLRLDVIPGARQIQADVLQGNYYADSILLGPTDVTSQRVELTPASPPIKIILKPAGTLRGTIEEGASGTVVLFPQSFTGIGYSTQSRADKTFDLAGIPPGDYYAIALDHFDPRTMAEAVRMRSLMPMATSVRVEQGSVASVQLRLNRVPD